MTSIVGILCSDGIVIGTDSSATYGDSIQKTIEQKTIKIFIDNGLLIIAGTGEIGLGQRFYNIAAKYFQKNGFSKGKKPIEAMTEISIETINNFKSTHMFQNPPRGFGYGALLAFTDGNKFHLCEFDPIHFRPELKLAQQKLLFSSMGSGQPITDPFLGMMRKIFWDESEPNVAEAKFIAAWTLQHAIDLNPEGINGPIQMAAIRKNSKQRYSAVMLSDDEIQEHMSSVKDVEQYIRDYKKGFTGDRTPPPIPELEIEK